MGRFARSIGGGAPQVKAKAKERLLAEQAVREFGLASIRDPERVLSEIGCIAFVQVGDLYDEHGRILPVKQLPPHVQAAVASSEAIRGNVDQGDRQFDKLVKGRLWDKPKMLKLLAKHHGLLKESVAHQGAIEIRWKGEE